ncbi:hypothetical protein FRC06_010972, partial [Ceratobasidium sp. 370]
EYYGDECPNADDEELWLYSYDDKEAVGHIEFGDKANGNNRGGTNTESDEDNRNNKKGDEEGDEESDEEEDIVQESELSAESVTTFYP